MVVLWFSNNAPGGELEDMLLQIAKLFGEELEVVIMGNAAE